MRKTHFIFLLIIFIGSNSCKKQMEKVIIEQNLEDFEKLALNSVFTVYLTQGIENKIRIEGAKTIIEKINFSIINKTLTIENGYKGKWMHPKNNKIIIYLTVKKLTTINANETCHIQTLNTLITDEMTLIMASKLNEAELNINCDNFQYWNNFPCGGKIKLTGNTNSLFLYNVALMAINASEFNSNYATVHNLSKGDCKVNCLVKFKYKILGEGNIYLKGNPPEIIDENPSSIKKVIVE